MEFVLEKFDMAKGGLILSEYMAKRPDTSYILEKNLS
jgi:hypothetical protein